MEMIQVLHMNGNEKETSYAGNSTLQRRIISLSNSRIEEAVIKCLHNKTVITSMGIAELGCSSGPNSLMAISKIIHTIQTTCFNLGIAVPELRVSLNDLPGNDFNSILASLPDFYRKIKWELGVDDGCFVSAVAGSFYGRLFPRNNLHIIHSSSSLHWLSQVPPGLDTTSSDKHLNKGKIYISKTSPACVAKAYLSQFQNDFYTFLRSRAEEMVPGGQMVLSFLGRASPDPSAEEGSHQWELLAQALMNLASRGLVEEEKIDAFNAPYYAAYAEEVERVIQKEGSFMLDEVNEREVGWDEGYCNDEVGKMSKGRHFCKSIRAVVEPMLECRFGREIMDELFQEYGELLDDHFTTTNPMHLNLVISLIRC